MSLAGFLPDPTNQGKDNQGRVEDEEKDVQKRVHQLVRSQEDSSIIAVHAFQTFRVRPGSMLVQAGGKKQLRGLVKHFGPLLASVYSHAHAQTSTDTE